MDVFFCFQLKNNHPELSRTSVKYSRNPSDTGQDAPPAIIIVDSTYSLAMSAQRR